MLLSYIILQTNFKFYFLGKILLLTKNQANIVCLNLLHTQVRGHREAAQHTQGFLPVNMDLQLPILVEWRPHIHKVTCGGSRGSGFKEKLNFVR